MQTPLKNFNAPKPNSYLENSFWLDKKNTCSHANASVTWMVFIRQGLNVFTDKKNNKKVFFSTTMKGCCICLTFSQQNPFAGGTFSGLMSFYFLLKDHRVAVQRALQCNPEHVRNRTVHPDMDTIWERSRKKLPHLFRRSSRFKVSLLSFTRLLYRKVFENVFFSMWNFTKREPQRVWRPLQNKRKAQKCVNTNHPTSSG